MNDAQPFKTGFFTEEGVISGAECDRLLNALTSLSLHRSRAGSRHLMSQPDVKSLASDPRMLRLARLALGTDAIPFRATLFDKSGRANWLVVWHQDTALPLHSKFDLTGWGPWSSKAGIAYCHAPSWALQRIVALRVHLDASTADTGPLRVLAGTHSAGVMNDEAIFALARNLAPVDCVIGRGGVLGMYPLLVHSSSKARSPEPRRVLHIEYADSLTLAPGIHLTSA
jgi:ectoine hydroxylase-related dioxygenase (phytanoyl-CoA dioxygenase family)